MLVANKRNEESAPEADTTSTASPRTLLGFRDGINGPHAARTMMLDDLTTLFGRVAPQSLRADYASVIIESNCLSKPTKKARELAFRFLSALYGLDPKLAVFRVFRSLWSLDEQARPLLALSIALARDPLLRSTESFILSKRTGEAVAREDLEQLLSDIYPDRFSDASLKSFAQNISGTWSQAGFLTGRTPKYRAMPVVTPTSVAFCLFLGHLEGLSGQRLFSSRWMNLLGLTTDAADNLASIAARRDLLVFLNAGGVKEVRFPEYLTAQEEELRQEVSHVEDW